MNPQDTHRSSTSNSQPIATLAVAAQENKRRNRLEEIDDGMESEHPRSSSQEDSSDRSKTPSALSGTASVNMLQLSTFLVRNVPSTSSCFAARDVSFSELKQFENGKWGGKTEGEGDVEDDRKREREHKKRSKNWARLETLKLIRERIELDERFKKSGRKFALWEEIARSLQRAGFARDGQQCKDKWEKLTAGYKEVKDGTRDREDHPFFDELDQLLSSKPYRKENGSLVGVGETKNANVELCSGHETSQREVEVAPCAVNGNTPTELREIHKDATLSPGKRKRASEHVLLTDLAVVQDLLETVITRQQRFFKDLLDAIDRKEQVREQIRHERDEKWRAEERAHRYAFNNAMIFLTQRLLGEGPDLGTATVLAPVVAPQGLPTAKKRSKNWKRTEVLHLIRFRREMENKFSKSTRRVGLWEELGENLTTLGIKRDGKQCREKWDKLMAEYKDVSDGRKDQDESPYFAELSSFLAKADDAQTKFSGQRAKDECVDVLSPA